MYGITIEHGEKIKCPKCHATCAIENDNEILYRNITLLHFEKSTNKRIARCKQCKNMIEFNS
jgi:hypothetical protein